MRCEYRWPVGWTSMHRAVSHFWYVVCKGTYIIKFPTCDPAYWCPPQPTSSPLTLLRPRSFFVERYMVAGGEEGEHLSVATTRPETILGDTAVCVHPEVCMCVCVYFIIHLLPLCWGNSGTIRIITFKSEWSSCDPYVRATPGRRYFSPKMYVTSNDRSKTCL